MRTPRTERIQRDVGNQNQTANVYSAQKWATLSHSYDGGIVNVQAPSKADVLQIFTGQGDGLDSDSSHLMSVAFGVAVEVQSAKTFARRERFYSVVVNWTRREAQGFGSVVY